MCPMVSATIFLSLPATCSVQVPSLSMYGVWFSCLRGGSTQIALLNRVEPKAFCLINSTPLTDCLDSLSHRRNVASLSLFYRYFHANCSFELTNCMPPPVPQPHCTRLLLLFIPILSIFLMQKLTSTVLPPILCEIGQRCRLQNLQNWNH